uniref:Glycosyltransferase n=1 Tax=Consolida orientalis TaxID=565971 RepID=F8R896_9MAGN|nr:UDP-glucosyltransferase [Consolida orientalis]
MASSSPKTPHIVCVPAPAQGHINPMFKLAKLFHSRGFYITFVHSEFSYQRLLQASALDHLKGLNNFRFETIPDGLPPENKRGVSDVPELCKSMRNTCADPFRSLILKLNSSSDVPPVTCIVADVAMDFTLQVSEELGPPVVLFFTLSGCGVLGYMHYGELLERGYFPLREESFLSNGYLDTEIDWIPAMKGIRLKDLPSFLRTTDPDDIMFNCKIIEVNSAFKAKGVILNTFDDLEQEVLDAIKSKIPQLYTIGPLSMLCDHMLQPDSKLCEASLWEEDTSCLEWLQEKDPKSVLYVNIGSLATMTSQQLGEFAWGLANSMCPFLWVIRPDILDRASGIVSEDYKKEIGGRGLLVSWCQQEKVLKHPSIGGFLTHCGWNSTLESLCEGVPMICWPFFAEQQTNCFYICNKWGIGMEIDFDVKRVEIGMMVKELMKGEKGLEMRNKVEDLMSKAIKATTPGGSSHTNFEMLMEDVAKW